MKSCLTLDRKTLEKMEEAAQWIKVELEKRGIIVRQAKEKMGRVRVYVTLGKDQHQDYQEVYAAAVRHFSTLAKAMICEDADYPDLLSKI